MAKGEACRVKQGGKTKGGLEVVNSEGGWSTRKGDKHSKRKGRNFERGEGGIEF